MSRSHNPIIAGPGWPVSLVDRAIRGRTVRRASAMNVYRLEVEYNTRGHSPWDWLTHRGELEALWPLEEDRPLAATWQPLRVQYVRERRAGDFLYFDGRFAVRESAVPVLGPVLGASVEFLPLRCRSGLFFALHPLGLVDLAADAEVRRNEVSRNITVIHRYAFDPAAIADTCCFRARQPRDSAAGEHTGFGELLISEDLRRRIEAAGLTGVRPVLVFDTEPHAD